MQGVKASLKLELPLPVVLRQLWWDGERTGPIGDIVGTDTDSGWDLIDIRLTLDRQFVVVEIEKKVAG